MRNALIVMMSRSGSSMVTGIFAAHGFWTGPLRSTQEYETFENADLNKIIRQIPITRGEFCRPQPLGWEPEQEPWVIKVGIEHLPVFRHFDAEIVKVRRSHKAIVASLIARHHNADFEYTRRLVKRRQQMLDSVEGITVFTDDLVRGDFRTIDDALWYCDAELNPVVTARMIHPSKWHH